MFKKKTRDVTKDNEIVHLRRPEIARISATVLAHERAVRPFRGSTLPRAVGGGGSSVFEAEYTGAWPIGQSKIVTVVATTATVTCVNRLGYIQPRANNTQDNGGTQFVRKCYVIPDPTSEDGVTFLVNAEV